MQKPHLKGSVSSYTDKDKKIEGKKVVIKPGPLAYKTAEISTFADPASGTVKSKSLTLKTFMKKPSEPGWDFDNPKDSWRCEGDEEIGKIKALLDGVISETATWRKVDPNSASDAIIRLVEQNKITAKNAKDIAVALSESPEAVEALADSGAGRLITGAIQLKQRNETLDKLEKATLDPTTTENQLQKITESDWWLFGGRFIDKSNRRQLTVLDQLDIPLICYDGSLHIVELKLANIPDVVIPYRNHHIVGPEVNKAVGQAENYLRELEQYRPIIKQKLGLECSRISATVVIGHKAHASVSEEVLYETLRTYNSHLSSVEVVTYDQLIANTRNALQIGQNI